MVDVKDETTSKKNVVEKRIQWDDLDPKKYYFFNGLLGGSIDLMMYPLDVIRTRLQVQGSISINQKFPHYTGTFDGLRKLYQHEGFKGYYKGFLTSEVGYLSSRAIYFGTYEVLKQSFQKFTNQSHLDESSEQCKLSSSFIIHHHDQFILLFFVFNCKPYFPLSFSISFFIFIIYSIYDYNNIWWYCRNVCYFNLGTF